MNILLAELSAKLQLISLLTCMSATSKKKKCLTLK